MFDQLLILSFEWLENSFGTKPLEKSLTRSLLSIFRTITDKDNLDNKSSKVDIVIGCIHGQRLFRSDGKFSMRDKEGHNKDSYVIKNGYTDCTKDTYKIFQRCMTITVYILNGKKMVF